MRRIALAAVVLAAMPVAAFAFDKAEGRQGDRLSPLNRELGRHVNSGPILNESAYTFPSFTQTVSSAVGSVELTGLPAGSYNRFSVAVDWGNPTGDAWSAEALWALADQPTLGPTTTVYVDPGSAPNAASNGNPVTLNWSGFLTTPITSPGAPLYFLSVQNFAGTGATWSNVRVTLDNQAVVAPSVAGTLNVNDTTSTYATPDVSVIKTGGNVTWYKVVLGQDVTETNGLFLDIDTEGAAEGSTSFDTEIGLFDAAGILIASDDDSGSGVTSQLTFGDVGPRGPLTTPPATTPGFPGDGFNGDLLAGTYYLAVAGFNATFASGFNVVTDSTSTSAIVPVNIRTNTFIPEPATLAALAGAGLMALRRRGR